jgi:hypothetical protein
MQVSALGFASLGSACTAGVLRFGIHPEKFRPLHEALAKFAGRVGIPLIGLGFLKLLKQRSALPLNDMDSLFVLCLSCCASLGLPHDAGELYTVVAGMFSMGCVLKYGMSVSNNSAIAGVLLFVFGGAIIGGDQEKCIMGVRCANLFHYSLGIAILLIGASAPR